MEGSNVYSSGVSYIETSDVVHIFILSVNNIRTVRMLTRLF